MITRTASLRRLASLLAFAILCASATPALAAPGDLDTSFGDGGVVVTNTTVGDVNDLANSAYRILLQPDGKIVTVGPTTQEVPTPANPNGRRSLAAVVRYNLDGSLDTTFGTGGIVLVSFTKAGFEGPWDAALQPDGKILVVIGTSGAPKMNVARLLPDGTLDPSFGKKGKVKLKFDTAYASSVVLQPDGKIVLVGAANGEKFAMARIKGADGKRDRTFGAGGIILGVLDPYDQVSARLQMVDGQPRFLVQFARTTATGAEIVLARLRNDGTVDTSFGSRGSVVLSPYNGNGLRPFAFDPQGRIVVMAQRHDDTTPPFDIFGLVRLSPDGALDPTFGDGGFVETGFGSIAIDPATGGIVVAGAVSSQEGGFSTVVTRLGANGEPDATFGDGGSVVAQYGDAGSRFAAVAVQTVMTSGGTRQRIVAAGSAYGGNAISTLVVAYEW